MKKYIRAMICILFSLIKFLIIKIYHFKGFKFSLFNLISPFVEIDIGKKGCLILGKFVRMRSGTKIFVRKGAEIRVGNNTSLNHGCMVIAHEKITLGNNVQFGPNVLIYDHDHDYKLKDGLKNLKYKTSPVLIGDNVWIGANVVILRGTFIGENSVVGAGSVIKGIYPSNTLIVQKRDTLLQEYKD